MKEALNPSLVANAFATVIVYTLIDGFGRDADFAPQVQSEAHDLVLVAQGLATTDSPSLPAAVRLECLDKVYSQTLATYTPPDIADGSVLGRQGSVDDWAWLIIDALVNSYEISHADRVALHARATQLVQRFAEGAPSVYLPAAIRQRLAAR